MLEVLKRRVDQYGVWLSDGADIYAVEAKAHQADHRVTLSNDPQAPLISLAKTFIDGTYHGRRSLGDTPRNRPLTRACVDSAKW